MKCCADKSLTESFSRHIHFFLITASKANNHVAVFKWYYGEFFLNMFFGKKLLVAPVSIFAYISIYFFLLPIFNLAYASVAFEDNF